MEKTISIKELLETLSNNLKTVKGLEKYTFAKNNKTLIYKDTVGNFRIELNACRSFDLDRREVSNEVIPYYYRRFDTLHDWFKKHTVLSSSDFNSRASIFLGGNKIGFQKNFHFLVTTQDFDKDLRIFKEQIANAENIFFNKFQTITDLYKFEAVPIVSNKDYKFNMNSVDDLFILLRLVYLVSPDNFDELNIRIHNHFKILYNDEHPHALAYMPKYDEIISDLRKV